MLLAETLAERDLDLAERSFEVPAFRPAAHPTADHANLTHLQVKQAADAGIKLMQRLEDEQVNRSTARSFAALSRTNLCATAHEQVRCTSFETELGLVRLALEDRLRLDEAERERGHSEASFWKEKSNDFESTNELLVVGANAQSVP